MLAAWSLFTLTSYWKTWALDLTALYLAAHFYAQGAFDLIYLPGPDVFLVDPPAAYLEAGLAQDAARGDRLTPYLYPPIWAALLAPVTKILSMTGFFKLWLVANVAATVGAIWIGWLWVGRGVSPVLWCGAALALVSVTVVGQMGFAYGQPQVVINFLIIAAFFAVSRGADLRGGALLGVAAAIKLTPAVLVLVLVMEKRWRALGAFAGVGGALGLASIAIAGWPLHAQMLDKLAAIDGHVMVARITASLELVLFQAQAILSGGAPVRVDGAAHMTAQPGWMVWAVRAALVAGLLASWHLTRRVGDELRLWLRMMAVYVVVLVTGPLAWVHALALPLVMLAGLIRVLPLRAVIGAVALAAGAFSMPLFFWVGAHPAWETAQIWGNLGLAILLWGVLMWGAVRISGANFPD